MEYKGYHVPTPEELEAMKNVDIETVDKETLVDIRDVKADPSLPRMERMLDYIRQIKNPYCYLCNGTVVKVSFAGERTLEDCITDYLRTKLM